MEDAIAAIVAFVEGRMSAADFEQRLYSDPEIERFLTDDPTLMPGTYVGLNTYLFAIQQDFASASGVLNVQGALAQFLERRQIAFQATDRYADLYDTILAARPRWLGVSAGWVQKNLLPQAGGRTGTELEHWLHDRFLELFKHQGKPPRWIQSPNWPIGENGPLVFLGQLKIPDYFHDEAAAYVFHDPVSGCCETVIQVY